MSDLAVATAYNATGAAWSSGPARIYDRLADELVGRCPISLRGASVLDVGAGTGAASRAARRLGGSPVAVDVAAGMLEAGMRGGLSAVVGDALTLPFASCAFHAAVAAFSLNHLSDPTLGLRETARVVRSGGAIVASSYAADDHHPVRDAVSAAAEARGWIAPSWYDDVRRHAMPQLATVERVAAVAVDAGLRDAVVEHVRVPFPELGSADLVAWRLGMAYLAPFVERLDPGERAALTADAVGRLGDAPMLVRSVIVLVARV